MTAHKTPTAARGELLDLIKMGLKADEEAFDLLTSRWHCSRQQAFGLLGKRSDAHLAALLQRLVDRVGERQLKAARADLTRLLRADKEAAGILMDEGVDVATLDREETRRRVGWLQGRARAHVKGETFWLGKAETTEGV